MCLRDLSVIYSMRILRRPVSPSLSASVKPPGTSWVSRLRLGCGAGESSSSSSLGPSSPVSALNMSSIFVGGGCELLDANGI